MFIASGSPSDSSARAWPAWILSSARSCCVSSGSCSSRIVFAMCDRDTPTRSASSSCFSPSSSRSAGTPRRARSGRGPPGGCSRSALRAGGRRRRCRAARPARSRDRPTLAARSRRSPAMSSYPLSPARRTTIGCRMPTSRIEAASDAISSSSKWVRGCFGLGATAFTGTSSSPETTSPASGAPGISADSPRPVHLASTSLVLPCGTAASGACGSRRHRSRVAPISATEWPLAVDAASGSPLRLGSEGARSSASSSMTTTRRSGRCPGGAGDARWARRAAPRAPDRPPPTRPRRRATRGIGDVRSSGGRRRPARDRRHRLRVRRGLGLRRGSASARAPALAPARAGAPARAPARERAPARGRVPAGASVRSCTIGTSPSSSSSRGSAGRRSSRAAAPRPSAGRRRSASARSAEAAGATSRAELPVARRPLGLRVVHA